MIHFKVICIQYNLHFINYIFQEFLVCNLLSLMLKHVWLDKDLCFSSEIWTIILSLYILSNKILFGYVHISKFKVTYPWKANMLTHLSREFYFSEIGNRSKISQCLQFIIINVLWVTVISKFCQRES